MQTSKSGPESSSARVLAVGDNVSHERYGTGRVFRILEGGSYFINFFISNANQCCSFKELKYLSPHGAIMPVAPPRRRFSRYGRRFLDGAEPAGAVALPEGEEGQFVALRILEAMRTGVVGERVELYTIGRGPEMEMVSYDLDNISDGAVRVFLGDYGVGKTHMLECIEAKALSKKCLTARIALNSKDVSPGNPQRVYRALMLNLSYPDHDGKYGLMPLFREARRLGLIEGWLSSERFHCYLSPALYYFNRYAESLETWGSAPEKQAELDNQEAVVRHMIDWLEGQEAKELTDKFNSSLQRAFPNTPSVYKFPALKDYRTFGHIYANILSGIAYLARQVGYAGLVLLLDEAEMYNILSSRDRTYADQLFGYYSALALGTQKVHSVQKFQRGGHPNHRSVPVTYNPGCGAYKSGVYCVFAMTMDNGGGLTVLKEQLNEDAFIELSSLSNSDYQRLCSIIIDMYRRAYPGFVCDDKAAGYMGQVVYQAMEHSAINGSRQLLRCILELLDYSRLCREDIGAYVHEMMEHIKIGSEGDNVAETSGVERRSSESFAADEVASSEESMDDEDYNF
ncbi:MAG: BREX system ATP-binding domain-containing protein [Candidatus Bruticola sp.]